MKKRSIVLSVIAICVAILAAMSGCSTSENWVRKTIEKNYYRFDGDYSEVENMKGLTIEQMMEKLDIYSAYYTEEEYATVYADNNGNKSGIGVSYSFLRNKGVELHAVIGNSPAKKAGLKAGDIILSAQSDQGEETVFSSGDGFADFINARAEGENFKLNLSDGRQVTLAKSAYTASYACMYTQDKTFDIEYASDGGMRVEKSDGGISALPEGTAYVYLYQFYGGAYAEMAELMSQFNAESCSALILDLRGNGGGYVDLMSKIGGLFTSRLDGDHLSMRAKYKNGREETSFCEDIPRGTEAYEKCTLPAGTPVYIMANENTASASEALIGILVSYGITGYGDIFLSKYGDLPAKSYGKGIMQSVFTCVTGERLKLTVAGIYWPNDKTIHGVGLTADDGCAVAPSSDFIVNVGYDDELEYVISKIKADRGVDTEG